jgi:hypothetical protein
VTFPSEPDPSQPKKRRTRKKPAGPITDLQALISSKDLRFESPEDPAERRSRLSIKEAQANHELWRDKMMIFACLVALIVLGLVSILFLFMTGQSPETRTWAAATLSAIVSGVVTYSLGRVGKIP